MANDRPRTLCADRLGRAGTGPSGRSLPRRAGWGVWLPMLWLLASVGCQTPGGDARSSRASDGSAVRMAPARGEDRFGGDESEPNGLDRPGGLATTRPEGWRDPNAFNDDLRPGPAPGQTPDDAGEPDRDPARPLHELRAVDDQLGATGLNTVSESGASGKIRTRFWREDRNPAVSDRELREAAASALAELDELQLIRDENGTATDGAINRYRSQIRAFTDNAAYFMNNYLLTRGWFWSEVVVAYQFSADEPETAFVTFQVREGPVVGIEPQIDGNLAFSDAELRPALVTAKQVDGRSIFVESRVNAARDAIESKLRNAGYLDARVEALMPTRASLTERWEDAEEGQFFPSIAKVNINIEEGDLYLYRSITLRRVSGGSVHRELEHLLQRRYLNIDPTADPESDDSRREGPPNAEPYRATDQTTIVGEVKEWLLDRGYAEFAIPGSTNARVEATATLVEDTNPQDGRRRVDLRIEYNPGSIYRIGSVEIESGGISRDFLRSRIVLDEAIGATYDARLDRISRANIYGTNIVRSLNVTRTLNRSTDEVDFLFQVEEVSTTELIPYVGWGSYELLRGSLTYRERNLFGVARQFEATAGASVRSEWAEIGLTDPYTISPEWPLSTRAFYLRRTEPAFSFQEFGFEMAVRHRISTNIDGSLFYQFRDVRSFDFEDPDDADLGRDVRLGTLSLRLLYSNVNNLVRQSDGMKHAFRASFTSRVLGADVDFVGLQWQSSFYISLFGGGSSNALSSADGREPVGGVPSPSNPLVLALRYLIEVNLPIFGSSYDQIPVSERVFNGGATSVRSYAEKDMRPFNQPDVATGGVGRNIVTVELRFPLIGDSNLFGAVFADAGNLASEIDQVMDHWRIGVGAGVRYLTPIGPLRVDLAYNPISRPGETLWQIHLWIGYPF